MSKLTGGQIERALKAVMDYAHWPIDPSQVKQQLEAAAPHLQYPIADPTSEELVVAPRDWNLASNHGSNIAACCRYGLLQFVARRNAALLPKLDPRRDKVKDILIGKVDTYITAVDAYKYADAILKALDEVGHD